MSYLIFLYLKSTTNLDLKKINTLKALKLKKNTLRIMPYSLCLLGMVKFARCVWAMVDQQTLKELFKEKFMPSMHIRLNNPKKGHITTFREGLKTYDLFKKEFIDRMYLRL